ncbi:MAG: hypothetical protein ACM3IJ_02315 [Candidatus Levyibacteriota bacterium]
MADNQKNDKKAGVNPVVAGVAGAVVGAGMAVAGTMALKDEKNRKKVRDVATGIAKQASEYMGAMPMGMKSGKATGSKIAKKIPVVRKDSAGTSRSRASKKPDEAKGEEEAEQK